MIPSVFQVHLTAFLVENIQKHMSKDNEPVDGPEVIKCQLGIE